MKFAQSKVGLCAALVLSATAAQAAVTKYNLVETLNQVGYDVSHRDGDNIFQG